MEGSSKSLAASPSPTTRAACARAKRRTASPRPIAVDAVVGAISGAFSFGVSNIASSIGKGIGTYISNSAIGGLKIGKVFTGDILGSIGKKGGELLGGFAGGMFFDKYANKLFNKEDSLYERLQNNLQGSIFSEGLNFFRYLWRTI